MPSRPSDPCYTGTLRLPAEPRSASRARAFVREFARDAGFDPDAIFEFDTAVGEAVTNAIEHGGVNDDDATTEVGLRVYSQGGMFVVEVRDRGPGFDPRRARRADIGDASSERGRGLSIIRALMDDLELTRAPDGGMTVRMVRRLPSSDVTDAAVASR
jgi:serine/threonine-protein kinase RsbW